MERRCLVSCLGAGFTTILAGCTALGRNEPNSNQEETDHTDELPDEFVFEVTVTNNSNAHLTIQEEESESIIEQSFTEIELTAINQTDSTIQSVDDEGFFSSDYRLKRGDDINEMYFEKVEAENERKSLEPNEQISAVYSVWFSLWMIGDTFSTDTSIEYNYEGDDNESSFSIEASTEVN